MNQAEIKIMGNIEEYGCHVTSVFDPKEEDPNFTYTVGINKQESRPEVIILGLRSELSSWIANEYNRRVQEGEIFTSKLSTITSLDSTSSIIPSLAQNAN